MDRDNIVYSTDPEWSQRNDFEQEKTIPPGDTIYVQREKKGRGGKTVTTITNLSGDLKSQLKELKIHCGSGGTIKKRVLELQGDQRDKIAKFLKEKGLLVKMRGG